MLTRSGLDIVVGRALGTVVMTVRGPLQSNSASDLYSSVGALLADAPERVVIDLTGVTDLDDDAVAVLERAQVAAEASDVQLQLTSRRQETLERLGDTGLNLV